MAVQRRYGTTGATAPRTGPAAARRVLKPPALALLLVLSLLTGVSACVSGPGPGNGDAESRAIQALLDRRAAAVLDHDTTAFLAAVDPSEAGYREEQRELLGNLAEVPLSSWEYRLTGTGGFAPEPGAGHRVAAEVRLSYGLAGHDEGRVTAEERLTLSEHDGRWYVAAEHEPPRRAEHGGGSAGPREQLWEQGRVTAVRGSNSLVLGVGQGRDRLRGVARTADRAVPAVDAALGGGDAQGVQGAQGAAEEGWPRRVVVLVPRTVTDMAELLGDPPGSYRGIAAVTTGEVGAGRDEAPADRVIVNPDAYGTLGESGRRVVLTHETAHVATRAYTTSRTPLWLSEGFADWAGYRETDPDPARAAPELRRQTAAGLSPGALPTNEDFGFAGDADRLATAYERGWLACRMIADRWGERALTDFYRAVGESGVDSALRRELGVRDMAAFTQSWRAYAEAALS